MRETFWTPERQAIVRRGYAKGRRAQELAEALGTTKNAVIGCARRLGLSGTHPNGAEAIQERAYGLARTMRYGGATYAQIAEACGINIATAWRYTGDISQ